jgi:lipoprotein-anchoring transpeptidase ErfK/SrfK
MFRSRFLAFACLSVIASVSAHAEAEKAAPHVVMSETQDARPHISAAAVAAAEKATNQTPVAQAAEPAADKTPEAAKEKAPANSEVPNGAQSVAPIKEAEAVKPAPPPSPTLTAKIDLARQTMVIAENGDVKYSWPISSGAQEFPSPRGTFHPQWLAKMWYSKKYDNAPMPNAVFITGGVAIHATQHVSSLGRPASHGCIRLAPGNAKTFYNLVQRHGLKQTRVSIYGTPKWRAPAVASRDQNRDQPQRRRYVQRDDGEGWFPPARKYRPSYGDQRYVQRRYRQYPSYSNYQQAPRIYYRPSTGQRYVYVQRPQRRYYYNNDGYGYGW